MIVSIHQPGYLPYLGFFKKIQESDLFIYFDDSQFEINGWDNRNQIKTSKGPTWITVPVYKPFKKQINEVIISNDSDWSIKHSNLIEEFYKNSQYFELYWPIFKSIISKKWNRLIDLNLELIKELNKIFEIKTPMKSSSELDIKSSGTQLLVDICKTLGADTYLSGIMGKNYLDDSLFKKSNIQIIYQNFHSQTYRQLYGDFISNLSSIDLILNEGNNSKNILKNSKNF